MSELETPANPEDISSKWLTQMLRCAQAIQNAN